MKAGRSLVVLVFFLFAATACDCLFVDPCTVSDVSSDTSSMRDSTTSEDSGAKECLAWENAGGDDDGDGLSNAAEDKNLNCVIEPELRETDPLNADTDGDGLSDGDEDINHDGFFDADKGETDPLDPTTEDGTLDNRRPGALTCVPELFASGQGSWVPSARSSQFSVYAVPE